jgi:predicted nucleic-acid-binding protein
MIAIDTNVLLRYLVGDDKSQTRLATELISKYFGQKGSIFINNIVVCELIWVLESGYKYPKAEIVNALNFLLRTEEFAFENLQILNQALDHYSKYKCDFSDVLIGKINSQLYNCSTTYSFDKGTASIAQFSLLKY